MIQYVVIDFSQIQNIIVKTFRIIVNRVPSLKRLKQPFFVSTLLAAFTFISIIGGLHYETSTLLNFP